MKAASLFRELQLFSRQSLDLDSNDFKRVVGNALRCRVDPQHQKITGCRLGYFVKAKQLVWGRAKSASYANQRCEVWLSIAADIVCIPAFTQTAASCGFRVRNAQFIRQVLQVPTKRIHRNVLFWKTDPRHELNGVIDQPVLFACGHRQVTWRDEMRVPAIAMLVAILPWSAVAQSTEGLCDLAVMASADDEQIKSLLSKPGGSFVRCYDGYTPLHVAVSAGNLPAIQELAQAGSDLNARNDFGSTSLHVAILASNPNAVEKLLDLGADIHAAGPDSMSPLEFARHWGEEKIVEILIARGARM